MGPLLGGVLSKYSSIDFPFYICCVLAFIDLVGRLLLKPKLLPYNSIHDHENILHTSLLLLKNTKTAIVSVYIVLSSIITSSIEASLVRHLFENFHLTPFQISIFFLSWVLSSVIFGIIGGKLSDSYDRYSLLKFGLISTTISTAFLGITSNNLYILIVSCFIFGASTSLLSAPTLPEMGHIVNFLGQNSYGIIYGITNIGFALGMLLGPLLGDLLYRFSNNCFPTLTILLSILCIHMMILHKAWDFKLFK